MDKSFFDIRQTGIDSSGTNNHSVRFLVKKPKYITDNRQFFNFLSEYTRKNAKEAYI